MTREPLSPRLLTQKLLACLALAFIPAVQAAAETDASSKALTCNWTEGFTLAGLDGDVFAIETTTTAQGVEVFAGGRFTAADGVTANGVARWTAAGWQPLAGPDGVGVEGQVFDLALFDSGSGPELYAAGYFDFAGGKLVYNVARWTGSDWQPMGTPPGVGDGSAYVEALEVFDDGNGAALYAAGPFGEIGGIEANGVARWDGTAWSTVGTTDGPSTAYIISLAGGDDGTGPALYAGRFQGTVLKFDGERWTNLGSELAYNRKTRDVAVWDDGSGPAVYAAGQYYDAVFNSYGFVSRWNGVEWTEVAQIGLGFFFEEVHELLAFEPSGGEPKLLATGDFFEIDDLEVNHIAAWDGTSWSPLADSGGVGLNEPGNELAVLETTTGQEVLVGGGFFQAGDVAASRIARWNGVSWSELATPAPPGAGVDGPIYTYVEWDDGSGPALYAGGDFLTAGGLRVNHVARWDGTHWTPLAGPNGVGTSGWVAALEVFDDGTGPALYAGGRFETAGGEVVNNVAKWDGQDWSALDGTKEPGVNSSVRALRTWHDGVEEALYVGGFFYQAGGEDRQAIARWDGQSWSALGVAPEGIDFGAVLALEPWDGEGPALYMVGSLAGNLSDGSGRFQSAAKWNGFDYVVMGNGVRGFLPRYATSLTVWDDGTGATLWAAGQDPWIVRWNGLGWVPTELPGVGPIVPYVSSLEPWDGRLLVGGDTLSHWEGDLNDYLLSWDGSEWQNPPGGVGTDGWVFALEGGSAREDESSSLFVGGDFSEAGPTPSSRIGQLVCASSCAANPERLLCLGEDRFVVDVTWRDFDGGEGRGRVVPFQTGDSGLFYFFDADNWEMLVKVLDACSFNEHFWVFSAATTNVEYTLTVTDIVTGVTKSYFNPLGVAAPSVTDTEAFATCDATVSFGSAASSASYTSALPTSPAVVGLSTSRTAEPVAAKTGCVASDTVMCLEDGRFALEIDWRDFEGDAGPGYVVEGTPSGDSGLFQFFGEDNWEVLVKVLDACGFNDRFWVFSAATTNVEYTLRVTDTETGETVSYFNPLGNAADAVTDTDAFATCP